MDLANARVIAGSATRKITPLPLVIKSYDESIASLVDGSKSLSCLRW
jgi:hypothetical protein